MIIKTCDKCGGKININPASNVVFPLFAIRKLDNFITGGLKVTCKDCIHYSLCNYEEICHYDIDNIKNAKDCSFFQDRSLFVELPQSVHLCDAVHFVLKGLDEIDLQEYTFTVGKNAVSDTVQFITEIGTYGFWVGDSPREFAPGYDDFYYWYELGETVFLSREEAEQFLKERES